MMSRHLFVKPKRIREAYPNIQIPSVLDELVARMLEKKPASRPSAEQVCEALERFDPMAAARTGPRANPQLGRAARMVSAPPTLEAAPRALAATVGKRVGWLGEMDGLEELALAANALVGVPFSLEDCASDRVDEDIVVVYAPGATADTVRTLVAAGYAVVADAQRGDLERLTELLRAGASEVVVPPAPDAVAEKLVRVLRRTNR